MASVARLHAVVKGSVQGVGFRYWVQREAWLAGLSGWVRNLPDGSVECVAEGPRPSLEDLASRLAQGPQMASVNDVHLDWDQPVGDEQGFEIRL